MVRRAYERRPEDEPPVLTIGHSTRTFEKFAGLLMANGVECVVDVRRFPHSLRHPRLGEDVLPGQLREEGIGYSHLPKLGGLRRLRPDSPNAGWRNTSFRGYADHMSTPEFREGFGPVVTVTRVVDGDTVEVSR